MIFRVYVTETECDTVRECGREEGSTGTGSRERRLSLRTNEEWLPSVRPSSPMWVRGPRLLLRQLPRPAGRTLADPVYVIHSYPTYVTTSFSRRSLCTNLGGGRFAIVFLEIGTVIYLLVLRPGRTKCTSICI